jgi:tripartite-type tricarboxylate transporter receptor subunit TctC
MNISLKQLACAGVVSLAAIGTGANAQAWPNKPITWIVGGAAGGPTDAVARTVAQQVSVKLGQSIVIENIGGAGGTIASTKVARAKPDGYTFLVGHVGYVAAAPSLYTKLEYNPVKDFDAIFRIPDIPGVVVVNANSPYKTLAEMLAYARQNPGKLNFGDAGVGSMSNLVAAMLASRSGTKITAVSYKGNGPAMLDVIGGTIDGMIDPVNTVLPQVRNGKVRAIAVTSRTGVPQLPGVPPVADLLPGFEGTVWFGIYGPKGTPKPVIEKMHAAYLEAMKDPAFTQKLQEQGMQLLPEAAYAPAAFDAFTESEVKKYQAVIKDANIQPQ